MFCTNCGASNKNIAKFCINCGESFSEVQIEEKVSRAKVLNSVLNAVSFLSRVDFLQAIYDFSLIQFFSPKIMKFLYGLSILSAGLIALLLVIVGFRVSMILGIFSLLIGAPLVFLLIVIYTRVILETILVIFRIADHLANAGMVKDIIDREEDSESRDGIQWNI
jgi:hypothetical protein